MEQVGDLIKEAMLNLKWCIDYWPRRSFRLRSGQAAGTGNLLMRSGAVAPQQQSGEYGR